MEGASSIIINDNHRNVLLCDDRDEIFFSPSRARFQQAASK